MYIISLRTTGMRWIMNPIKKYKWKLLIIILLSIFAYIAYNVISIWQYSNVCADEKCDVAIVLGAACSDNEVSEVYKQRLNHAIELYNDNKIQKIIVTGGVGDGNSRTDANVARSYLVTCGISENVIIEEGKSKITQENLENSKVIMDNNGYKTALIVSDPLHMKRSILLADDMGITSFPSPTDTSAYKSLKTQIPFIARETFFLIGYKWYRIFMQ